MKYILFFLIILSFIGPVADKEKSFDSVIKDSIYNYITCLDNSINYLSNNFTFVDKILNIQYELAYNNIMEDRVMEKHLVISGETLDDIIKTYNNNIDNIEDFRKVVYLENKDTVTKDYQVNTGEYILVPSEKLISKN
ncbi:MAG: hypothetical protein IJ086_02355 [Clostridium sp.]|nr:hypothetical protein [Clostridium sp.]